jgi:hypothetical protein
LHQIASRRTTTNDQVSHATRDVMTGIYLKCDNCGATIDGVEVTRDVPQQRPLLWSESHTLRMKAKELGWTEPFPDQDLCPSCSQSPSKT